MKKKRNRIRRHIPDLIEWHGKVPEVRFNTVAELLRIAWVKKWETTFAKGSQITIFGHTRRAYPKTFYRWAKSGKYLMAEWSRGYYWLVIGHLDHPELVDLPEVHYPDCRRSVLVKSAAKV